MYSLTQLKQATPLFLIVLVGFGLLPVQGVVPPPDGGYPGFNTAEGQNALLSLTTGSANTAVGWFSLFSDTENSFNTATGAGALLFNDADKNTATGAAALLFNTTGFGNTAVGATALLNNTEGENNTATGSEALFSNTTADFNTAIGSAALYFNTEGEQNAATGTAALYHNTEGHANTANGFSALFSNTIGGGNTAIGYRALGENTEGDLNTAVGINALGNNTTGSFNTVIGRAAGASITGDANVCIGEGVQGVADVDNTTWIRNVYASVANSRQVYVNSDNKIGTLASSRRYKDEIRPMAKASEAILSLRPVSFRYKKEVDPTRCLSFGLIAEEVAHIDPDLVTPDPNGKPETVRYEAVNAMLLNEFLKEHQKVEKLEATVSSLVAMVKEQAAQIQKVSAHLELSKSAPQTVLNGR
jgi:hypothetical protein